MTPASVLLSVLAHWLPQRDYAFFSYMRFLFYVKMSIVLPACVCCMSLSFLQKKGGEFIIDKIWELMNT